MGDLTSEVFVAAEYGAYVEFGTTRAPAQPYFTPAVVAEEKNFNAALAALTKQ